METTASSNPSKLRDPIRRLSISATPEEKIRQGWIERMVTSLGYPPSLLAVEKEISQLPHLTHGAHAPKRRVDIVVFSKNIHPQHPLYPLLLIECKATRLTSKSAEQVIGYNAVVGSPFIAVANGEEILTGCMEGGIFIFRPGLPSFAALQESAKCSSLMVGP